MTSNFYKLLVAACVLLWSTGAQAQLITTYAGNGIAGHDAWGGPATQQQLNSPVGISYDLTGFATPRLFIADSVNALIRMVDISTGAITTFAGGGTTGLGDGKAATLAQLTKPTGVSADGYGNVYIADVGTSRIRKVNPAGIIVTCANNTGLTGTPLDGMTAVSQKLSSPYGVKATGSGELYISDRGSNQIYYVNSAGKIYTIAGSFPGYTQDGGPATIAELNGPSGVAVDASGNLYIADRGNNVIRKVSVTSPFMISTIAGTHIPGYTGDGAGATAATLNSPSGLFYDPAGSGTLYIADMGNNVVRKITPLTSSGIITTVAGGPGGIAGYGGDGGGATLPAAKLNAPSGVAMYGGALYIADKGNHIIRKVAAGNISTVAGTPTVSGWAGDGSVATTGKLSSPQGIAFNYSTGDMYIADAGNNRIRRVNGGIMYAYAGVGTAGDAGDGGPALSAELWNPTNVLVDNLGNVLVSCTGVGGGGTGGSVVRRIDASGTIGLLVGQLITPFYIGEGTLPGGTGIGAPEGIAYSPLNGDLFIATTFDNRVRFMPKVTHDGFTGGRVYTYAGNGVAAYGGAATYLNLNAPTGTTIDAGGNTYIADRLNNVVRMIDPKGAMSTIAGNSTAGFGGDGGIGFLAKLNMPVAVAYYNLGVELFIADQQNNVIRKVDGTGTITTYAGTPGVAGNTGDGGLATSAKLNYVNGLDVDQITGDLYLADEGGNVVRKIDYVTKKISRVAGTGTAGFLGTGGPATSAELDQPYATCADTSGNVYIADRNNHIIRKVDRFGKITTYAGTGIAGFLDDPNANNAMFNGPSGLTMDAFGNMWVADQSNNRIRKIDKTPPHAVTTVAGGGTLGSPFYYPICVATDATGSVVYIGDGNDYKIHKLTTATNSLSTFVGTGTTGYGPFTGTALSAKIQDPKAITVDKAGNVFFVDFLNHVACKVPASGATITVVAGQGPTSYGYSGDGVPATSSELYNPSGVAVDATGNLFISDMSNQRIRRVDLAGNISTYAGNGTAGYSGDGGQSTKAQLNSPYGICIDTGSRMFIADKFNDVIREVIPTLKSVIAVGNTTICQDSCELFSSASIGITDSVRWSVDVAGPTFVNSAADTTTVCFPTNGVFNVYLTIWYKGQYNIDTVTITVNQTPAPPITKSGYVLSVPTGYLSYQWFNGTTAITGAVTNTYTFTTAGTYKITVDSAGCTGSSSLAVVPPLVVTPVIAEANKYWLSQQGQDNGSAILYAARPVDQALTVTMYDATGREIMTSKWEKGTAQLQIRAASLAPGMYLVKLTNNNTSEVLKWLKN